MRTPIRVRLTAAFALVLAVVLGVVGLLVHRRAVADANRTIDTELRTRARTFAAAETVKGRLAVDLLGLSDERFGELVDTTGTVVARSRQLPDRPIAVRTPGWHTTVVRTRAERRRARLLVRRIPSGTLIVATALDDRDEAFTSLQTSLWWGGGITLVTASFLAWLLAGFALRPVERLRVAAARHSSEDLGRRLVVPGPDDEIGRLATTLNEMLDRIEDSVERERAFVDRASHELRTPLANLSLELELARRGERSADELRRALDSASAETARLVALASNLLLLARATDGGLPILVEECDLARLLGDTLETFRTRAGHAGVALVLDAPSALPWPADAVRVRQAVTNLLDNALRVTPAGGTVSVTARDLGDAVEVAVADAGPGFEPEVVADAFERFARGRIGASEHGAGLGLSIVAAVAAAHGGTVRIDPAHAGGAVVRFSLARSGHGNVPSAASRGASRDSRGV